MSNKITKISNMKLLESFLQINFLKGFKYIDKAGEILNRYQKDSGNISYNMSPDRLIIPNPSDNIAELRISNSDFWCHYLNSTNLGEVFRTYQIEAKAVLDITKVSDFLRVGCRNYYVYDLARKQENLNSLINLPNAKAQLIQTTIDFSGNAKSSIRIKLVKKQSAQGQIGVLFDIDTYIEGKQELSEISQSLQNIKGHIESDEMKDFINNVLKLLR